MNDIQKILAILRFNGVKCKLVTEKDLEEKEEITGPHDAN